MQAATPVILKKQWFTHYTNQSTLDEAMIPFKGRLTFKQYMKKQANKNGGQRFFVLKWLPISNTDYSGKKP